MKLFFGLFGCGSNGVLYSPSGKKIICLPKKIAFKIHPLINKFGYVGNIKKKQIQKKEVEG